MFIEQKGYWAQKIAQEGNDQWEAQAETLEYYYPEAFANYLVGEASQSDMTQLAGCLEGEAGGNARHVATYSWRHR